jgi:hypothetical protein
VTPPQTDEKRWETILKQYSAILYRLAWLINPDDPLAGLILMWRDIVAWAASSAARNSGRNSVWDNPPETAFSTKLPDRSTAPATVLQAPAQPAPEHPLYQMVAVPEPVGPERSGVVPNPGAGMPLTVSVERSNRGVRWLFMDGWVNPAKADPVRVLNMMGLIQPDWTGDGVDRGIRRIRRARAAG